MRGSRRDHEAVLLRTLRHGTRALYEDPALYDAFYRRRSRDVRFYVALATKHGGPVLELGAGTARVAAAIASAGIEVVGVEAVPEMLARARTRLDRLPAAARARVTLVRADLRRLGLRRRFPLVIVPFCTLMHFYNTKDVLAALAACRRHLAPGGRLVFDVLMPDAKRLAQDPGRLYAAGHVVVREHGTRYRLREASHYDAVHQVRTTVFVLDRVSGRGGRGGRDARRAIPVAQRQFFPAELALLLRTAGFSIERRDGDFEGGPLDDDSESQVVIARAVPRRP